MSKDAPPKDKAKAPQQGEEEALAKDVASPGPQDPATSTQSAEDDIMSDEEARRLLAAMDEPMIPEESPGGHTPEDHQPMPVEKEIEVEHVSPAMEEEESPPAEADLPAPRPQSRPSTPANLGDEVEEFSPNEFASDADMLSDFAQNSSELMESLDQNVLVLEKNPDDRETIEAIFRAAHTLKGAAGMFGFRAIERIMHRMENLFDLVRKGSLHPTPDTIDAVFRGLDALRTLLTAAVEQKPSGIQTAQVVKALDLAITGKPQPKAAQSATVPTVDANPKEQKIPIPDQNGHDGPSKKNDQSTIRVDLDRLDLLVNLVGELVIDRTRFAAVEHEIRTSAPQLKAASALSETVQIFGRHMNEIHEIIMKIRMVPIGNAFNKFTRVVRDLARQLGKEIDIEIAGEETEIDKTLVEQIGDPLIHLIRNSCDHGIEMPEVRRKSGKSSTGKILLSARQEGHHVTITIADDGKGIPVDVVRRKGIERGLIKEHDVLTDRDIFNLIFEPGFSTAEKVTNLSGRGVGMDVVRKQIGKLKGIIDIDSTSGKGTKITIRLPLTLAIVQSLLVKSKQSTFALPLSSVIESVRMRPDEIQYIGDAEVIKRHDKVLPLMYLSQVLDMESALDSMWYRPQTSAPGSTQDSRTPRLRAQGPSTASKPPHDSNYMDPNNRMFVVIVGSGEKRFGIVVDQLLHQQEMVIKSMGPLMNGVACIAGGAVLGNGEVVLVLDIPELEEKFRNKNTEFRTAAA